MCREAAATPPFQRALVGAAAIMLTCSPAGGCGRPALHCGDTVTIGDRDTFLVALVERGHGLFAERLAGLDVAFTDDLRAPSW